MSNRLLLASLLVAVSTTTTTITLAAPTPVPPPPEQACLLTLEATTPVFQIERKSDVVKDYLESKLSIVSNGAWMYTETRNQMVVRSVAGCLAKPELGKLTAALATATWKTSRAELRCMAYAADYFTYSYRGKAVLTTRMCDGLVIDKATLKAMAGASAITDTLVPKQP